VHRDLKAENLLLDNNMNIKIAGNWDTAGSKMMRCKALPWVYRNSPAGVETADFLKDSLSVSLLLCVITRQGNMLIINIHTCRAPPEIRFVSRSIGRALWRRAFECESD
jgi:serine/threonine protein kinase